MDFLIFVINFLFSAYYLLLVIRAILPWFPHNRLNAVARPVYLLTEPVLSVIRLGLPPLRIGMDVSPFIVIVLLWVVQRVIVGLLAGRI
ncbi:MAG: YggT family protein [Candidatus Margulisbacteria bacterium]|nr:YggT family protein [Candidatus Margulisiibacteriota bacterium]